MSELENIATVIAPEIGLPMKVTRWIVDGVVILALAAAVGFVIWKVFFAEHAAQAKHDKVEQQVTTGLAHAGQQSGQQAVKITVDNQTHATGIDRETQKAIHDLLSAPGANQPVDPALAALARRSICLRASAASLNGCQQLLGSGP